MGYEFLRRLFASCSNEAGDYYMDGLNLCELYERLGETTTAEQQFHTALDEAAITPSVWDDVGTASWALANAHELQGFINGFRLCARLETELHRWNFQKLDISAAEDFTREEALQ